MDLLKNVLGIGSDFIGNLFKKGKKKLDEFGQDPLGTIGNTIKNNVSFNPIQSPASISIGPLTIGKPAAPLQDIKFELPKQIKNPATDFLKDVALGVVNSVPHYTQGTAELNQQVKDLTAGKGFDFKKTLSSVGKTAELPLNIMTGGAGEGVVKNVAEQGFKRLGTQTLINATKAGLKTGAGYGAAFGATQGVQDSKDITSVLDYIANIEKDVLFGAGTGAVAGGALSAGAYGVKKAVDSFANMIAKEARQKFAEDIASKSSKYLNDQVISPFRKAFGIDNLTQKEIADAAGTFQAGGIDDKLASDTLLRSTKEFLPQFSNTDSITQSKIWNYILARKNGSVANVPPELEALDKQIFKVVGFDIRQGGFIKTKEFTDLFKKAGKTATTPEESIAGLTKTADEIITKINPGERLTPQKINSLKALRASLNKEAYGMAGVNPANGKGEKAAYELARQSPEVGQFIDQAESYISKIDDMIERGSGAQKSANAPIVDLITKSKGTTGITPNVPPAGIPPKVADLIKKQRGFVGSVQEATNVTPKTKAGVTGDYATKTNDTLMGEAKALLQDGASIDFKNTKDLDKKVAATIQEALNLDKVGQHDAAAALYNNLSEHGTDLGKGVQAFSLLDKMSPESISLSVAGRIKKYNAVAIRKIPELTGEQTALIAERVKALDGLKGRNRNIAINEIQKTINEFIPSTLADKAITVWKAGLLTSLRTHERNLLGNTIMGAAEIAKDPIASVADMIMKMKTGKRSMTTTLQGAGAGAQKGYQAMKDIVKLGYDPEETISKFDIKTITWGNNPVEQFLKKATNAVFRPLAGEDKIFWHSAYARSLYDQAGAAAMNAGKQGNKKFVEKLVKKPTEEMLKIALVDANAATFHDKNVLAGVANAIKRAAGSDKLGRVGSEVGKVVTEVLAPFTGVPSSIVGKTIAYSPIGLVKGAIKAGIVLAGKVPELQRQAAQEIGRGTVGTGLFGLGAYLMGKGLMTGQPKDAKEADLWAAKGKQANSILIGGKWRSINSIGPQNLVMLAGAKYAEEMGKPDGSLANYSFSLGKDQMSQTFLTGVQQPLNALTDPARYGKSYVGNQLSSIVPNIVKDASKAMDPNIRENNSIGDYFTNSIPVLRNQNLPKRDVLGNEMKQEPTGIAAFFDLFNSKTPIDNAVIQELDRLQKSGNDATPSKLKNTQTIRDEKIKLTFEQLNNLEAGIGEAVKPQVEALISSDTYKNLSDEKKASAIGNIVADVRTKYKNINGEKITDNITFVKGANTEDQAPSVGKDLSFSYVDAQGGYKTIDVGKVASMPEKTRYDKTLKEKAAFKIVDDILDNLPKEKQAEALTQIGMDPKSASYYNISRQDDDVKHSYVLDAIESSGATSRSELLNMLVQGRVTINNKMLVSNGVVDDLYNDGYISSAERAQLKKITLDSTGKQTTASKATTSGTSATTKAAIKALATDITKGPTTPSVSDLIASMKKNQAAPMKVSADSTVPNFNGSKSAINGLTVSAQPNINNLITKSKTQASGIAKARALVSRSGGANPTASNSRLQLKFGGTRSR